MASYAILAALVAGSLLPANSLRSYSSKVNDLESYTFLQFVKDYDRRYEPGSDEWNMREELFNNRIAEAKRFNALPDKSWTMGISQFLDSTEAERKRMLGYKGQGRSKAKGVDPASLSLRSYRSSPSSFSVHGTPTAKERGTRLQHSIKNQGECGSCWAMSAIAVLEGHMEANTTLMDQLVALQAKSKVPSSLPLSVQTAISCTENPRHCGGTGGCGGATVELAYDMIKEKGGLPFATDWSYEGTAPPCRNELFSNYRIAITGYQTLPSNRHAPLLQALVSSGGPIAISVDASNWFWYFGGIYSELQEGGEFTVNHAVVLEGYKKPDGENLGFYAIKNSWGSEWGMFGHIHVEMKEDEESHCGWDKKPRDGIACDGDPDVAWVCGTCGILYDSIVPFGLHLRAAAA